MTTQIARTPAALGRPGSTAALGRLDETAALGRSRGFGLDDILRRIAAWRETARQRRALAGLSPERLRDIGLDEEAAVAEARRVFWDVPGARR